MFQFKGANSNQVSDIDTDNLYANLNGLTGGETKIYAVLASWSFWEPGGLEVNDRYMRATRQN